jgi:hypothetical protein
MAGSTSKSSSGGTAVTSTTGMYPDGEPQQVRDAADGKGGKR